MLHIKSLATRSLVRSVAPVVVPSLRTIRLAPVRSLQGCRAMSERVAVEMPQSTPTAAWLIGCAAGVFGIVVVGGVTRLTRSGLSMVDWRPQGGPWPADDAAWEVEFNKYKEFPEYKRDNSGMSLEEFKNIYFWEWLHRHWGRALGVVFAVPGVALALAGKIPSGGNIRPRLLAAFGLGGTQGLIGWWMVKSGLDESKLKEHKEVRVSPYRLATHLGMAMSIYSLLVWTALDTLRGTVKPASGEALAAALKIKMPVHATTGAVFLTALTGAFVAGNDAGRAFNDWPMYAGRAVPEGIWDPELGVANFFENTATVQFTHRNMAYATLAGAAIVGLSIRRAGGLGVLPPAVRRSVLHMMGMVGIQASLGISALMHYVPVSLGSMHQAGAMATLTFALWSMHSVRAATGRVVARAATKV